MAFAAYQIPKSCFSEETFQETVQVENSKEFPYNFVSKPKDGASPEENQELVSIWPEVLESFVNLCTNIPAVKQHLTTLLQEHVFSYKQASGVLVASSYKAFEDPGKITPDTIKLANVLGCCVNMLLCVFIIIDDIIDCSEMRFGKPCWYTRKDVGMAVICDAIILENGIHKVLTKYLAGLPCLPPTLDIFHETSLQTAMGMYLDTKLYEISGKPSFESFTEDIHKPMAMYKGSYPFFIIPITLGMYLAGKYDADLYRITKEFANEMGLYVIAQNDVLECYGNPAVTGKNSTDIGLGKCSWLIVESLKHSTSAQKQILNQHYGRPGYEHELEVRTVYDNLGMLDKFLAYEEESFNRACGKIQQLPKGVNKKYLFNIVEGVYNKKCIS